MAIINPDVEIRQGIFSRLFCTLKNPKVGIAVPMLKTRQGKVLENSRKFPTLLSVIKRRLTRKKDLQISKSTFLREIDWAQGSFLVMRKKNFEFVGRFDERYFIFVEDADLCRKFREKKMKIIQDCSVFAYHSEDRLSDGKLFLLKRTFWIHVVSFYKYFRKWGFKKV